MKKPELLAPAGNMLCLKAAILAGCDAIYLGGYMFGARAFSNNFSNEELIEAVKYAHMYNVKIYVTVNTIIYENEVDRFIDYIEFLYKNNIDAVIIQDIGMMDLVRQLFPKLEVHASTQMHIHNLEGVKLVEDLGLKRAVLARETTISEIENIKKKTNIELEIFVHGALCISYSGQCLMSSLIGGRSGNRGTCAGSCRQKYDVLDKDQRKVNKDEYNLSTKDLNSLDNIGKLIDMGVDSLKIEGRMKSPEYVYMVVNLYRKAIDSYINTGKINITDEDINNLKKTFNRMFTKGFMFYEENNNFINPFRPNHQGIEIGTVVNIKENNIYIKLDDDLNINDGIRILGNPDTGFIVTKMFKNGKKIDSAFKDDIINIPVENLCKKNSKVLKTLDYKLSKEINSILKNSIRKVKINLELNIDSKGCMNITALDGINKVNHTSNILVTKALNNPTSKSRVIEQLKKTGSTIYEVENIEVQMDDDLFIPIKELNELRRVVLDKLTDKRISRDIKLEIKEYFREVPNFKKEFKKSFYITNIDLYNKVKSLEYDTLYLDSDLYDLIDDSKKVLHLPRVITKYNNYSNHLLVGELGSVRKYNNIDTDFSLNVVNSYSIALLHSLGVNKITLSYELDDEKIKCMIDNYYKRYNCHPNLELIVYAKEEIMISKFDLLKYYNLNKNGYLKDKFNNLYKIKSKENMMYIYNYKPRMINNLDYYYDLGINSFRYNLIDKEDLNNII